MAKSGVSVKWDNLDKHFSNMAEKIKDTKILTEHIGEMLVGNTIKRFNKEESPEGEKWKKSRRAILQNGQTLSKSSGGLKSSFSYVASDKTVQVGTNKEYARIHQFGGVIKPKKGKYLKFENPDGTWSLVKEVTIPARPFIGISDDDIDDAKHLIADFMEKSFKG